MGGVRTAAPAKPIRLMTPMNGFGISRISLVRIREFLGLGWLGVAGRSTGLTFSASLFHHHSGACILFRWTALVTKFGPYGNHFLALSLSKFFTGSLFPFELHGSLQGLGPLSLGLDSGWGTCCGRA